jgi:hypothetical protein
VLPLLPRCLLLLPVAPFLFPQPASHLLPAVSCSSSLRTTQSPSRTAGRRRGTSGARGVNAPPPPSPQGSCHGSVDLGVRRRRHPGRAESSGRGGSDTDPVGGEPAPTPTTPPAGAVEPGGGPEVEMDPTAPLPPPEAASSSTLGILLYSAGGSSSSTALKGEQGPTSLDPAAAGLHGTRWRRLGGNGKLLDLHLPSATASPSSFLPRLPTTRGSQLPRGDARGEALHCCRTSSFVRRDGLHTGLFCRSATGTC